MSSYKLVISAMLAVSLTLTSVPVAFSAPGDVNSTNDGQIVQGGTYYNTPGSQTTFVNSGGGGLWVQAGTLVQGLEVSNGANPAGSLTGNGGNLLFSAPGAVVRIDGTINVSGILNGGVYTGNGGKVTIDSAFLYQDGQIYANGVNGGQVQLNVGAMTMTRDAVIEARGLTGNGGNIDVNATGAVDIAGRAIMDASGHIVDFESAVIDIEGGLVNMAGILTTDGLVAGNVGGNAGTIRIVAKGNAGQGCFDCVADAGQAQGIFSAKEAGDLKKDNAKLVTDYNGDIQLANSSKFNASGSSDDAVNGNRVGDGGTVRLEATRNLGLNGIFYVNGGQGSQSNVAIGTDGGNAGTVQLVALGDIVNSAVINTKGGDGGKTNLKITETDVLNGNTHTATADARNYRGGHGGNGGTVSFTYNGAFENKGDVFASGGSGGDAANAEVKLTVGDTNALQTILIARAYGGEGGNGGYGGKVTVTGAAPDAKNGSKIDVSGGDSGHGGDATVVITAKASTRSNGASATADGLSLAGLSGKAGGSGLVVSSGAAAKAIVADAGAAGHHGESIANTTAQAKTSTAISKAGNLEQTEVAGNKASVKLNSTDNTVRPLNERPQEPEQQEPEQQEPEQQEPEQQEPEQQEPEQQEPEQQEPEQQEPEQQEPEQQEPQTPPQSNQNNNNSTPTPHSSTVRPLPRNVDTTVGTTSPSANSNASANSPNFHTPALLNQAAAGITGNAVPKLNLTDLQPRSYVNLKGIDAQWFNSHQPSRSRSSGGQSSTGDEASQSESADSLDNDDETTRSPKRK